MRRWIAGVSLGLAVLCLAAAGFAQDDEAARANALFQALKRLEALPLYEDLAKAHPDEMLYFERLADCLGAQSAQLSDPAQIKAVRTRMRDAAKRAVEFGYTTEYIRMMANADPNEPLYADIVSPGKALLAEAEKAYTAGDFPTAMAKYTAAANADPKLYQAPLFAGDTAFVQHDLKTAAVWFARAIAIDPDRETAYRFAELAVHFDPVNLICSPQRYYSNAQLIHEFVANLGAHIKSVHAKDIRLQENLTTHLDEVIPGKGELNYRVLLKELDALGRDIPVMLEHLNTGEQYCQAVDYIRSVAIDVKVRI